MQWRGWLATVSIAVLVVGFVWRWFAVSAPVCVPPPELVAEFAQVPEKKRPDWLSRVERRITKTCPSAQTVVAQPVPNHPAIVVVNVVGDDLNEESTHWAVPWPAVNEKLNTTITEPVSFVGPYYQSTIRHTVTPLPGDESLFLVVNVPLTAPGWLSVSGATVMVGGLGVAVAGLLLVLIKD